MNQSQSFQFLSRPIRVLKIKNEPWWVAKEVCDVLEVRTDTIPVILDSDEHQKLDPNTIGVKVNAPHGITIINESGLYSLILRSRKPVAKSFKRWVTHEVLPQIRKTGSYIPENKSRIGHFEIPTTLSGALQLAADQARLLEEQQPKVEFYDTVANCSETISLSDAAKILKIPGIGPRIIFQELHARKILFSKNGIRNQPYQKYIDEGWFELKEKTFKKPDESDGLFFQTRVTQKGLDELRKLLSREVLV